MRSQTFDDLNPVWVDIYTIKDGGQDDDGNELPSQTVYYSQNQLADLHPKSGSKRAAESGTVYESTHLLFHPVTSRRIPSGATVNVRLEEGCDVVEQYEVVFPGLYGDGYELDLKVVGT